jgi:hypothetical protein
MNREQRIPTQRLVKMDENNATEADLSGEKEDETSSKRWMVKNRLDPSSGASTVGLKTKGTAKTEGNGQSSGELVS